MQHLNTQLQYLFANIIFSTLILITNLVPPGKSDDIIIIYTVLCVHEFNSVVY